MPDITTYTADVSICSQICRLAIQEFGLTDAKNVDVDIEYAMENYEPWFVRLQPKMTVPVMDYAGELIGDSKEILYYLAAKHPEANLYPQDDATEIDAFVSQFYDNFLFVGVFTFGHLQGRSEALRDFIVMGKTEVTQQKVRALAEDPEFADVAGGKLAEVEQRDFTRLADPTFLARADEGIRAMLSTLETSLSKSEYVCGDSYSLADIVATALLARVHFINGTEWFTSDIHAYWARMLERPSFESANVVANFEDALMAEQFAAFVDQN